jgi:glutamate:GABA antiporter
MSQNNSNKLSLFSLVMLNIIAIDSIRTLPFGAMFGLSVISYYILALLFFFLPCCYITMELATTFPNQGGIYVWVKKAYGPSWGFLVIYLQWLCNLIWYPTTLIFIARLLLPVLHYPNTQMTQTVSIICLFFLATLGNLKGIKRSGQISTICALFGTLLPMLLLIIAALWWGQQDQSTLHWHLNHLLPHAQNWHDYANVIGIVFGLIGIDMASIHAHEVHQPQKTFPRAIRWSMLLIVSSLLFATLALASVIPKHNLNIITGTPQAITLFLTRCHLTSLIPAAQLCMILGAFGSLSAWLIGPSKGLAICLKEHYPNTRFASFSANGVPTQMLWLQMVLITLITLGLQSLPMKALYFMLTVIAAQLYLVAYIIYFASAWSLRHSHPTQPRPYHIPGRYGMPILCSLGIIGCVICILLGFIPPIMIHHTRHYELLLCSGILISILPIFIFKLFIKKKNQKKKLK